jgi:hypothetical protein
VGGGLRTLFRLGFWLAVVVVVGFAGLVYLHPYQHCVVGETRLTASLTIDGSSAQYQCSTFVGNGQGWCTYTAGTQLGGDVLCQVSYAGDFFTVRGSGTAVAGRSLCESLTTCSRKAERLLRDVQRPPAPITDDPRRGDRSCAPEPAVVAVAAGAPSSALVRVNPDREAH